jgi:tRNA uridine 5-carbamoylmethylation protein Kti12
MIVEVLVGIIASGKSGYASHRARAGAIIVNDDAIVQAVHGGDYTLYDRDLKAMYKQVEHTMIAMAVMANRDVVIDRTNHTIGMRRRYVALARSMDKPVVAVTFLQASWQEHVARRMSGDDRGHPRREWSRVAREMTDAFEAPTMDEGFDNVLDVTTAREMQLSGDGVKGWW